MTLVWRFTAVAAITAWVAVFWLATAGTSADVQSLWFALPGLATPLAAAVACLWAARHSTGTDQRAWRNFAIGCLLYFCGNFLYLILALSGVLVGFPTVPEVIYFVMAAFFTVGMFQYGAVKQQVSRAQIYNFALIVAAVAIVALFILHSAIERSGLGPLGTVAAVAYPVLWFSVAAFGLVCLLFYARPSKRFAFALLVTAVFLEAAADFLYARDLLNGNYVLGGPSFWLWTVSTATVVWAAMEQHADARASDNIKIVREDGGPREAAEAVVPAIAAAAALFAAGIGAFNTGYGPVFLACITALAVAFAITLAARETWMLTVRRRLTDAVRRGATDLSVSRQQLSGVLESTTDSVVVLDAEWRIVFFNGRAAVMLGGEGEPVAIGRPMRAYLPPATAATLEARFGEALRSGTISDFEYCVPETSAWWEIHAYPSSEGISVFFRDISDAHHAREELVHQARHDALTGLANRMVIHHKLEQCIAAGGHTAILFVDLDYFKEVNDTLGHPVGDALLQGFAARLQAAAGEGTIVGRIGGDEFAVIQAGSASSTAVSDLARRILDSLQAPHVIDGRSITIRASIGIAVAPEHGTHPDELFRRADIALYSVKGSARGSFRFFERRLEDELQTRQQLKTDLAVALQRGEFEIHYQPVIQLATGAVSCVEALLRWHHPLRGDIVPDQFIPIAEETGMIVPIGAWVLRHACAAAAAWPYPVRLAVNLSTVQFGDVGLVGEVRRSLEASGLAAERLELEITESALLKDSRATLSTLYRLRDLGVGIALDDFGTGYASLGYLEKFPFSRIKVDRSFVTSERRQSYAIMSAVTALGHQLGAGITAEGVETAAHLERVRQVGCDEAQGFYMSRPLAEPGLVAFLDEHPAPLRRASASAA